jgi:hypothetical protein
MLLTLSVAMENRRLHQKDPMSYLDRENSLVQRISLKFVPFMIVKGQNYVYQMLFFVTLCKLLLFLFSKYI